jgi:tRNA-modifying protein YgfZ
MIIDGMTSDTTAPALTGIAPLPHLGIIRVSGADAAAFLQGQLTQDFLLLPPDQARLAAYCSPKGRMLASFVGFKQGAAPDAEILLICCQDVLTATLKRLAMYVLRAKVKLTDATADFELLGLAGEALQKTTNSIANYPTTTWATATFDAATVVALPAASGIARALWIAPKGTPHPQGSSLSTALWQWGEVQSGIAHITAPIVDDFVPQMLNYESVGGVNFKKGCYPGQEVVARSQFRGTLKRRAYLVHADAPLQAGDEVFAASDASQPCGTVAQAAAAPAGGFAAIVSMQIAAAAQGLTLASPTGPALALQTLPYALLEDV